MIEEILVGANEASHFVTMVVHLCEWVSDMPIFQGNLHKLVAVILIHVNISPISIL